MCLRELEREDLLDLCIWQCHNFAVLEVVQVESVAILQSPSPLRVDVVIHTEQYIGVSKDGNGQEDGLVPPQKEPGLLDIV